MQAHLAREGVRARELLSCNCETGRVLPCHSSDKTPPAVVYSVSRDTDSATQPHPRRLCGWRAWGRESPLFAQGPCLVLASLLLALLSPPLPVDAAGPGSNSTDCNCYSRTYVNAVAVGTSFATLISVVLIALFIKFWLR